MTDQPHTTEAPAASEHEFTWRGISVHVLHVPEWHGTIEWIEIKTKDSTPCQSPRPVIAVTLCLWAAWPLLATKTPPPLCRHGLNTRPKRPAGTARSLRCFSR